MNEAMENYEFEVRLPEEVMVHMRNVAKEVLKAEFAMVHTLYDDNWDDINQEEFMTLLLSQVQPLLNEVFDEVVEELGLDD